MISIFESVTLIDIKSNLHIICLESEAFYQLVEKVLDRVQRKNDTVPKWIDETEAKSLLHIKSKTTMQKLRDEGQIRFSQLGKKMILYDRDSILKYIETNSKNTF